MNDTWLPSTGQLANARWQWWLLLILVGGFALGFRLYYVTHVVMFQPANLPGAQGNAVQYYNYARNLVQHGVFSADPMGTQHPIGDSFRDPGYPVFLAMWMEIFPHWDSWYAAVIFSQAVLGAVTVVLWLCVGRRWMPIGWLAAAGMLMAIWPHSVAMSSHLLSETLYGFLVALALFVFRMGLEQPTVRWAMASGLCFSLAALTNGVLLPFATIVAAYMLTRRQLSVKIALILIATTICLATPWIIRNSMQRADQPSSTDRALMNLVEGSWPLYHSADMASTIQHEPHAMLVMGQINHEIAVIDANRLAGLSAILHRVARAPGYYLRWYVEKPALLWGWNIRIGVGDIYVYVTYHSPFDVNPFWRAVAALCHAFNRLLMVLALTACLLSIVQKRWAADRAGVALLLLFVTAVHSVLQSEPRYSIPYRGAEILFGVFAVYWLFIWVSNLRKRNKRYEHAATTSL